MQQEILVSPILEPSSTATTLNPILNGKVGVFKRALSLVELLLVQLFTTVRTSTKRTLPLKQHYPQYAHDHKMPRKPPLFGTAQVDIVSIG